MEPIHSGTTLERIIRTALLTFLVLGYAAYSLWDGYVAYPRVNVEAVFVDKLGMDPPDPLPEFVVGLTRQTAEKIPEGGAFAMVAAELDIPGFWHGEEVYFFGEGGFLRCEVRRGQLLTREWQAGPKHTATDIFFQKLIGFIMATLGFVLTLNFIRIITTRASLTDDGLKVRAKPAIGFDAMTGIRMGRNSETVVVEYSQDGVAGQIKLDRYVLKQQPAIVAAICERMGFENPVAAG